jgi:dTDP-D-glucose 4,6-dehydratase
MNLAAESHVDRSIDADGFFTEMTAYAPNSSYSASKAAPGRDRHHTR